MQRNLWERWTFSSPEEEPTGWSWRLPSNREFTKIQRWPGHQVCRHDIDEKAKMLRLWVCHKRGNRQIKCSGCAWKFTEICDLSERAVRDLPWGEFQTTVLIEIYRMNCPECGVKREKVLKLPTKVPSCKRFENAAGLACESDAALHVARHRGLPASTVCAIDLRYPEPRGAARSKPTLWPKRGDEILLPDLEPIFARRQEGLTPL